MLDIPRLPTDGELVEQLSTISIIALRLATILKALSDIAEDMEEDPTSRGTV